MRSCCLFFLCLVTLVACDSRCVYDSFKSTTDVGWHKDSLVQFSIPQLDSIKRYNLFITVRNTNEYQFQNFFLIANMQFPNGKTITDTLEYNMATPDGKWLGTGFSDLKENVLWYKEGVRFAEEGSYTVSLEHAMRKNGTVQGEQILSGITDVGFRIEKVEDQ